MDIDNLCTEQINGETSTNIFDKDHENSTEIPFQLFQFLSSPKCSMQSLCRICLTTDSKIMFPLYSTKDTSIFARMFTTLTGIEIYPDDGLPANVCKRCRTKIANSYEFKLQCEKATYILKSVLKYFTKDEPINDINNPDHVPELERTKVKQEYDVLNSEDAECLDDMICNENYTLPMLSDIRRQKKKKVTISVTDSNTLLNEIVAEQNLSKTSSRRKTYLCKYCNKKFYKLKLLRAHLSNNHPRKQVTRLEFSCSHCKDSFSSEHDLKLHLMLHSKGPKWRCNKCDKIFESKSLLRRHVYRHMESKRYSCDTCGKLFTELYALRRHSRVHTGETVEKKHECHLCDKKYSEGGLLAAHIARHEGCRPYVCSVCGKAFPSRRLLISHSLTHSDIKPYACSYCDKRFRHESTRNTHHRTHTGEKPYVCATCGKTFIQNSNLKLHMRTHTGEKPYSCSICNRKFSSGSSMKTHERTHTGERPYECTVCNKKFARVNMKAHMLTHTGERPYTCTMCPKKFVNATRLRDHSRVHSGEKPFECETCLQKFQTKSHLLRHMKTHIKEKKAIKRIEVCEAEFVPNVHIQTADNIEGFNRDDNTTTEQDCGAIVFDIKTVPIEVSGELVIQDKSDVKTEMLVIDGNHDYRTGNILNADGVIVSDINYANNIVALKEGEGVATTGAVLEATTVKLYQLDQSLLQIHSAGGQLTISKITSKMTANF